MTLREFSCSGKRLLSYTTRHLARAGVCQAQTNSEIECLVPANGPILFAKDNPRCSDQLMYRLPVCAGYGSGSEWSDVTNAAAWFKLDRHRQML